MAVLAPTETLPGPCLLTEADDAAAEEEAVDDADFKRDEEPLEVLPVLLDLLPLLRLDDFFLSSDDDDDEDFFFLSLSLLLFFLSSSEEEDDFFFLSLSLLLLLLLFFFFFSSEASPLELRRLLFFSSSFLSSLPLLDDLPNRGIFNCYY